jgi:predicted lipid carrier protein YhbT
MTGNLERAVEFLGRPLAFVPHPLQREAVALALRSALAGPLAEGDVEFLEGRTVAIEITDLRWRWPISVLGRRLEVLDRDTEADVCIRGRSPAFLDMAARTHDPDTLFFDRRLVIEGDTELGLAVKNFLDGVDEERFPLPLRHAINVARAAHAGLRRLLGEDVATH